MRLSSVHVAPPRLEPLVPAAAATPGETVQPVASVGTSQSVSVASQELDVAAAQTAATVQRLAVVGGAREPVEYAPVLPLSDANRYVAINMRNTALDKALRALGPEGIEQLPKTKDGFPIPPGMDENFWTAYHPEKGPGTSMFSNLTPEDRKMLYRATGTIVTPDGTSLGPGADKAFDLVFQIADDRINGTNGLDATSALTTDYLELIFAEFGRSSEAFDQLTLRKAIGYLNGQVGDTHP